MGWGCSGCRGRRRGNARTALRRRAIQSPCWLMPFANWLIAIACFPVWRSRSGVALTHLELLNLILLEEFNGTNIVFADDDPA